MTGSLSDCDLNQHAAAFAAKSEIAETNVLAAMRQAEAENDMVVVDLPGGSTTLALKALQRSNFVIVPGQASLPDAKDAVKTVGQIEDAEDLSRVKIARSLIWTRVLPGFESRSARHVRESAEATGVPVFRTQHRELAAFREMHVTGRVPRQVDPASAAAQNVAAVTAELLGKLERMAEAARTSPQRPSRSCRRFRTTWRRRSGSTSGLSVRRRPTIRRSPRTA